jgi:hypothetical protein
MPSGKSECEKTHKRLIKTRGEVRAAEIVTRAPPVDTEIVIQLMMLPLTLFVSALAYLQQSYLCQNAPRS